MNNFYITRTKEDALFCFYYAKETGIMQRVYENGRWKRAGVLLDGALENFTVTFDKEGKIYIFCQDSNGDIVVLTKVHNEEWLSRIILKNQSGKVHTVVQIHPIVSGEGMSLTYNVPSQEEQSNYIVFQKLDEKGRWAEASRIDKFVPMNNYFFTVQNVTEEHLLIFYQTRGVSETNIGYRELTPSAVGSYNVFHTTPYVITDTSFLTTDRAVHVVYCVRGLFSAQLIYRKKETGSFENPVILCEAQKIDDCLMLIIKDNLYVFYMSNSQLYYRMSEDKGGTFSKPVRYRKKFCQQPIKANYVSYERQRENKFFLRQVYVDRMSPWDVQIMPDLNEDFYPEPSVVVEAVQKPKAQSQDEDEGVIMRLKNRIEILKSENAEKESRIINLTNLLKIRNDELIAAEMLKKTLMDEKRKLLEELEGRNGSEDADREEE